MSAKLLNAFADENPDLHRQIGCMTGILQMFDRQHLLSGKRPNGQNQKRPPPGNRSTENRGHSPQVILDKNRSVNENQRISMESSRASFSSSSCSSSFSSLDCNKSTLQEHSLFDRSTYHEASLKESPRLLSHIDDKVNRTALFGNSPKASARQSLDFRDVVKDSIYRETHGLSVKTAATEDVKKHIIKHKDSPRLPPLSKSMDGSYVIGINGKTRTSIDLDESLRVLAKLKEAPWYYSEPKEPPRSSFEAKDSSFFSISKEAPRFSYDGREISRSSLDSRENKSAAKLREFPRLSLDSRDGLKSSSILRELERSNSNQRISRALALHQESGDDKRPPSVVAKLMGLEELPDSSYTSPAHMGLKKSMPGRDCDASEGLRRTLNSPKIVEEKRQGCLSSPSSSIKDSVTPRKPCPPPRIPIETAPWRQQEKGRASPRGRPEQREAHVQQKHESVYGEIEKKLKDIEFQQSNRDLRALKQILDSIQAKGLLEAKKAEEKNSDISSENAFTRSSGSYGNSKSGDRKVQRSIHPVPSLIKDPTTPRHLDSPIVIMKPAKSVNRCNNPSVIDPLEGLAGLQKVRTGDGIESQRNSASSRAAKDRTPKNKLREGDSPIHFSNEKKASTRSDENNLQKTRLRAPQDSPRHQQSLSENSVSSDKISSSSSPRLQPKRLSLEKKSHPAISYSDSYKQNKQSRQTSESVSPRGKLKMKPKPEPKLNGHLHNAVSEARTSSIQIDEISQRSDSNVSSASVVDEVTSMNQSVKLESAFYQGSNSTSCRAFHNAASIIKQKKDLRQMRNDCTSEVGAITPEQPSPVSVLDESFYKDELPASPVRHSFMFKDQRIQNSEDIGGEDAWNSVGVNKSSSNILQLNKINDKKLQNIESLVQKLKQLSSSKDNEFEADHISILCETQNPNHRYVSEILLASGLLLKDFSSGTAGLMPLQFHQSGYPMNPDLFLVLEQKKSGCLVKPESFCENASNPKSDPERIRRRLLFEVVNEILVKNWSWEDQVLIQHLGSKLASLSRGPLAASIS